MFFGCFLPDRPDPRAQTLLLTILHGKDGAYRSMATWQNPKQRDLGVLLEKRSHAYHVTILLCYTLRNTASHNAQIALCAPFMLGLLFVALEIL